MSNGARGVRSWDFLSRQTNPPRFRRHVTATLRSKSERPSLCHEDIP